MQLSTPDAVPVRDPTIGKEISIAVKPLNDPGNKLIAILRKRAGYITLEEVSRISLNIMRLTDAYQIVRSDPVAIGQRQVDYSDYLGCSIRMGICSIARLIKDSSFATARPTAQYHVTSSWVVCDRHIELYF